jgi:hypothetical protein
MSFQVQVVAINGHPGPGRALKLAVAIKWIGAAPAQLLNLQGRLRLKDQVIAHTVIPENFHWGGSSAAELQRDRTIPGTLVMPISAESVRWIEGCRGTDDVSITLELHYTWQEALRSQDGNQLIAGRVYWEVANPQHRISRSDWLRVLAELAWQEYEIFEVATAPLVGDKHLAEALKRLKQAQDALRNADHESVLFWCRKALESAAKFHAEGDNVKHGFALLLEKVEPVHENKRVALDALIESISRYAHLARHEKYPPLPFTRLEAEFILTATIGLFSFISRRLATQLIDTQLID